MGACCGTLPRMAAADDVPPCWCNAAGRKVLPDAVPASTWDELWAVSPPEPYNVAVFGPEKSGRTYLLRRLAAGCDRYGGRYDDAAAHEPFAPPPAPAAAASMTAPASRRGPVTDVETHGGVTYECATVGDFVARNYAMHSAGSLLSAEWRPQDRPAHGFIFTVRASVLGPGGVVEKMAADLAPSMAWHELRDVFEDAAVFRGSFGKPQRPVLVLATPAQVLLHRIGAEDIANHIGLAKPPADPDSPALSEAPVRVQIVETGDPDVADAGVVAGLQWLFSAMKAYRRHQQSIRESFATAIGNGSLANASLAPNESFGFRVRPARSASGIDLFVPEDGGAPSAAV